MNYRWFFEGKNEKEKVERSSYLVIIISAVMVGVGLILGGVIKYTVLFATIGAFLTIIGILMYVASQFMKGE